MILGKMFEQFARKSPVTVMLRSALEYALPKSRIDELFRLNAENQRESELPFSLVVDTLGQAVTKQAESVHDAYGTEEKRFPVSVTSLYNKLNGVESQVSRAIVQESASALEPVLRAMDPTGRNRGPNPPLIEGYRAKILDGKHLGGTQHRLKETRTLNSQPLPGQTLAVLDPELSLAIDVFPCRDAYAQERRLLPEVLKTVEADDLWIADRNFCTTPFLFGIHRREAYFLIRQHGSTLSRKTLKGRKRRVGRCETGVVFEQDLEITDPESGEILKLRRITVKLDQPTRDGEKTVHLLTNLPSELDAIRLAMVYLDRWQIENLFGEISQCFEAEIDTLCHPPAAILAFCIALLTCNMQSTIKGALYQTHGERAMMQRLSTYYLASEIRRTYAGMMIAIEAPQWERAFAGLGPQEMAEHLKALAARVRIKQFQKTTRGVRKPPPPRTGGLREKHVSTERLLKGRQASQKTP